MQTIAFNLPNDERVRKEKGAKKVMLRNSIGAKFTSILTPIANILMKKKQLGLLSSEAFFNNVLFHELSHSLGPAFVGNDETKGEVRIITVTTTVTTTITTTIITTITTTITRYGQP